MKELKLALKEDKIYTRQISKINKIELKDEFWVEELENLHVSRDIRALNSRDLLQNSQAIALNNNINNQAVRSRCVEIKIRALKQLTVFENSRDLLKKYIPAKYSAALKGAASTAHERRDVIDHILFGVSDKIERMAHVVKLCDIIIDDCDQAGWTLNRINVLLDQRSKEK